MPWPWGAYVVKLSDEVLKPLSHRHPIVLDDEDVLGFKARMQPCDAVKAHCGKTAPVKRFLHLNLDAELATERIDFVGTPIHDKNARQKPADRKGLEKGCFCFPELGMDSVVVPEKVGENGYVAK